MPSLTGTRTLAHLRDALALEAVAALRYRYGAQVAEIEGFPEVADAMRQLAESDAGHVAGLFDFLREDLDIGGGLEDTEALLDSARHRERDVAAGRYAEMAPVAWEEGFHQVAAWFETLGRAHKAREAHLKQLLESIG